MINWRKYLPVFEWLPAYSGNIFREDLIAGLTVCVMLVPQGMAYAMLAGMPPIYGLYGGLIPLLLYGLLGTSRQLSIGPVAVSALLVLAGISQLAEPGSGEYIGLVILTGLLIGILQASMGLFKLGFLVNFLSHPVIIGFTSAAAVIIAVSQLKYLFGFDIPRFAHLYETVAYAFSHLDQMHWPTFIICSGGILLQLAIKKWMPFLPGALIITILGVLAVSIFALDQQGVKIVGEVPSGLPAFELPILDWASMKLVLPTVFTVAIIGIVESIGIAKVLEAKNQDCKVRPNQELLALGLSKIGGAFFQSLPTSGSFTRSAVNDDAGAKTGMASIITALLIGLTLVALTPLFYYLPEAVLAAIVLVAVKGLFNLKEALHLWKIHKQDFFMMLATFVFTLSLGIEEGVMIGVVLSIISIIYNTSKAHVAVLGQLPNTTHFRNVKRFENAVQFDGVLIFRFDAQLYFGNVNYFKNTITELVSNQEKPLRFFVWDASSILDIDSSGLHTLEEILDFMSQQNIRFMISGAMGPVRDMLYKTDLMEKIGKKNQFMYIHDAVTAINHSNNGADVNWTPNAIQTNLANKK